MKLLSLRQTAGASPTARWTAALGISVVLLAIAGCRPPAVEFENLHLIASLRTACSAENEQWLEGVERAVKLRHEEGRMSDAEKAHFQKLIEQAKNGDWRGAEEQCFKFEKAQLGRTRTRPPPEDHHDHSHDEAVHVAGR